jgi:hypothetical protein
MNIFETINKKKNELRERRINKAKMQTTQFSLESQKLREERKVYDDKMKYEREYNKEKEAYNKANPSTFSKIVGGIREVKSEVSKYKQEQKKAGKTLLGFDAKKTNNLFGSTKSKKQKSIFD